MLFRSIFTIVPIITLLLIIGRYNHDNVIGIDVTLEVFFIGSFMIISAIILAVVFGKVLKEDTKIIIQNIDKIENGKYDQTTILNRPDELGEIFPCYEKYGRFNTRWDSSNRIVK